MDKKREDEIIDFLAALSNAIELLKPDELLTFYNGLDGENREIALKFIVKKTQDKIVYIHTQ